MKSNNLFNSSFLLTTLFAMLTLLPFTDVTAQHVQHEHLLDDNVVPVTCVFNGLNIPEDWVIEHETVYTYNENTQSLSIGEFMETVIVTGGNDNLKSVSSDNLPVAMIDISNVRQVGASFTIVNNFHNNTEYVVSFLVPNGFLEEAPGIQLELKKNEWVRLIKNVDDWIIIKGEVQYGSSSY